jgi:hypothetical protein
MTVRKFTVAVTTASDGSFTGYTPYFSGKIHAIHYVKTNFTDGVDFTITADSTGETIWTESNVNAAKVCLPRAATHSTSGVAALYASGGTAVNDLIALGRDRVKIVIASGGNATTGTFYVIAED